MLWSCMQNNTFSNLSTLAYADMILHTQSHLKSAVSQENLSEDQVQHKPGCTTTVDG